MPPAQAGVAAAVASTSRQVGQTLGVAVLGALAGAAAAHARLGAQFTVGTHTSWWLIAALGVRRARAGRGHHHRLGPAHGPRYGPSG